MTLYYTVYLYLCAGSFRHPNYAADGGRSKWRRHGVSGCETDHRGVVFRSAAQVENVAGPTLRLRLRLESRQLRKVSVDG